MDIIAKLDEFKREYAVNQEYINRLLTRQRRLEGAHSALLELAVSQGLASPDGSIIHPTPDNEQQDLDPTQLSTEEEG